MEPTHPTLPAASRAGAGAHPSHSTPQAPTDHVGWQATLVAHRLLMVDAAWTTWHDDGFTWWAHRLAQRFRFEGPVEVDGTPIWWLGFETDYLRGFDGDETAALTWLFGHNRLTNFGAWVLEGERPEPDELLGVLDHYREAAEAGEIDLGRLPNSNGAIQVGLMHDGWVTGGRQEGWASCRFAEGVRWANALNLAELAAPRPLSSTGAWVWTPGVLGAADTVTWASFFPDATANATLAGFEVFRAKARADGYVAGPGRGLRLWGGRSARAQRRTVVARVRA